MNIQLLIRKIRTSFLWLCGILAPLPWGGVGGGLLVSCSDFDDYNKEVADVTPSANQTLWENIQQNGQLSDFAALLKKAGFDDELSQSHYYTVWAPLNGTFDASQYQGLNNNALLRQFVKNHIADYGHSALGAIDEHVKMLNEKTYDFMGTSSYTFGDRTVAQPNIPSNNGLMHTLNGSLVFYPNIYEYVTDSLLAIGKDIDSLRHYVLAYEQTYLDETASVPGSIVDGMQTYVDSVIVTSNSLWRDMNIQMNNEDSTYTVLLPNNKAWLDGYNRIKDCYKYAATTKAQLFENGSIASNPASISIDPAFWQDSLTCRNIVSNLVFSKCYQRNDPLFGNGSFAATDTAYSTSENHLTNMQEVLTHTTAISEMSNGMARTIDSLTFNPWQTYNPTVIVTSPTQTMKVKKLTKHSVYSTSNVPLKNFPIFSKVPKMFHQWLFPDNSPYFSFIAVDSADVDGTTSKPEFNFALGTIKNNGTITGQVRSATYHIYVVTVPEQLINPEAAVKPYYLRFYLSYTDANNKQQYEVLPKGAKTTSKIITDDGENTATLTYVGDPDKVNVIDLGEFTFPACYYGLDAYPSLMMMHTESYTSSSSRAKYDQQMRVAGVYLVPKEYNDMWANTNE